MELIILSILGYVPEIIEVKNTLIQIDDEKWDYRSDIKVCDIIDFFVNLYRRSK